MDDSFQPEVTVLYCGRCLPKGDYLLDGTREGNGFKVRFVITPCSSKVDTVSIIKLIEQGADGVVLVACPEEQCQFGSALAYSRVMHARALIEEVGMDADRLGIVQHQGISAEELLAIARERAYAIKTLGENPVKSYLGGKQCRRSIM